MVISEKERSHEQPVTGITTNDSIALNVMIEYGRPTRTITRQPLYPFFFWLLLLGMFCNVTFWRKSAYQDCVVDEITEYLVKHVV